MKIWGEIPRINGIYDKNRNAKKVEGLSEKASKKDIISISDNAKDFQTIMKALKDVPDIRAEKTDEIEKQYQTGSYYRNSSDVAKSIIKAAFDKKA